MRHIKKIEVKGLWGRFNLVWKLGDSVNILSGGNGSGKSTLLGCVCDLFTDGRFSPEKQELIDRLDITLDNGDVLSSSRAFDPQAYHVDIINTFDMALSRRSVITTSGLSQKIDTELDWELFKLEKLYLSYQLEIGREVINALTKGQPTSEISAITSHKTLFFDTLDTLFAHTHKKIDRTKDNLCFLINDDRQILPWQLSSGEKQILIILTTVLVQNHRQAVMIMDEPEISLHFEWQKRLFEDILLLNPNLQLIVATHSPALVMKGWVDMVTQIDDIVL